MKMAYVITRCDDLGGAQVHVRDMAVAVRKHGDEAVVLGGSPGVLSDQLQKLGVPYIEVRSLRRSILPLKDILAVWELYSLFRKIRPDLVSAHSSKAGVLARVAAFALGIPSIFTAHGWAFSDGVPDVKRLLYRYIELGSAPLASRIITVSDYDRKIALKKGIASNSKIKTVHNGMNEIDSEFIADPGIEPPVFLTIARHDRQKDYDTLLRAFSRVQARHPDWKLVCVGGGPKLTKTRDRVDEMGLSESVTVLGFRSDSMELLSEAQVYCLISNWEGLPRSILEAMRAGLPVIASDVGGVKETIVPGETGLLVARHDVTALENAMEELGKNAKRRKKMGAAARERFHNSFRFDFMFDKTWALYQSVLKQS